jgi:predicted transcriptional regulator
METAKKRDRLSIIHDILTVIKENKNSIKPTPLLRYSNLSSHRFSEYLQELLIKDLIKEFKDKKGRKFYSLSDKGFRFVEKYKAMRSFIQDFDL